MKEMFLLPRRVFLKRAGGLTAGLMASSGLLKGPHWVLAESEKKKEAEVSPPEDLMREHGVLSRILLIYEEILKRLDDQALPPELLPSSAGLIGRFTPKI